MRRVIACAARAAFVCAALFLAACTTEMIAPPAPPPPPPPAPAAPQALAPPEPAAARAEFVKWFSAAGYKPHQIAALEQHARAESGFRACAVGPGGYYYIFQWSGLRLRRLHEFARTEGCPQLRTQFAFADRELRDPRFACFWAPATQAGAYAALRRGFGGGRC